MKQKNICVLTSTRADYNYFCPIIKKIIESKKLKLSLLVTGIHLLKKYGKTINQIRNDGIPITKIIHMYDEKILSETSLGKAVGKAISKITKDLNSLKPDLLLVLGDRYEALAAVIAASTLSIPIGHIHGGDNIFQGQIDEQIRHAITKFSHIHFPATQKSGERIKLLGEEEWRIHVVGSSSIDIINQEKLLSKEKICEKLGLNSSKVIIICLQHPYTFESTKAGEQMNITLQILKDLNLQTVICYPNNDPGSNLIINEIEKYNEVSYFKIFKNLDYIDYYSLLKNANLLIGNSSSGLIESPIFKLPVVNIGKRNKGRESAENVINVDHDSEPIRSVIKQGLSTEFREFCQKIKNPYGDGNTSERIVKILEDLEINEKFLIKILTY